MSAEGILDEIAERTGWNERSKLTLALEYIDNQDSPDAWQDFLEHAADEDENAVYVPMVSCKFCGKAIPNADAYMHQSGWVGECCWDERLRSTE